MGRDDVLLGVSTRYTPQTEKAEPTQVKNSAGGYVFQVDADTRLRRFITIGTAGARITPRRVTWRWRMRRS